MGIYMAIPIYKALLCFVIHSTIIILSFVIPLFYQYKMFCLFMNSYWSVEVKKKELGGKARLWIVIFKCIWFRFLVLGFMLISEVYNEIWWCCRCAFC